MATKAKASLEAIAWDLYGAPLEEFTEARNSRAKEAKDAGEADCWSTPSKPPASGPPTSTGGVGGHRDRG